jgi:hypothetical protein
MSGRPLLLNGDGPGFRAATARVIALRAFGLLWLVAFFPAFWFYHGLIDGSQWDDVAVRNAQNEAITYHPWGWATIYLTNWGGVTQLLFWLLALVCSGSAAGRRRVDRYFTLAWPVGVFIGVMFYGSVLPGIIGAVTKGECGHEYPATVNRTDVCGAHGNVTCAKVACRDVLVGAGVFGFFQHGVPMMLIILEGCATPHRYGPSWAPEMLVVLVYACAYIVWNEVTYHQNGCYPYPFQQQLQAPPLHAAYVIVLLLFICGLYFLGRWCNRKCHSSTTASSGLLLPASASPSSGGGSARSLSVNGDR